ncbi:non-canonical purine NTP pyrophosphatase, RdgB/HAM1 family [Halobacteriales archaeon SW_7_71_33]|nr:MAG: non-canonical purine NTP pyrophosphatase, RdgB/HAM1 family [Halobacteriales archaeon SW_7_71_33]
MLSYVTSNPGKAREARSYLDSVDRVDYDYPEIQSDSLATIATHGARDAHREVGGPVLVDDAGLFVDALGGFPGPYSSFVHETVGVERVWRLAEPEPDHRASFRTALAYCDESTRARQPDGVRTFEGRVTGRLVPPRGNEGFGYDPVFEYDGRTFAEMDPEEKNAVSHRGRALEKFAEWYHGERADD